MDWMPLNLLRKVKYFNSHNRVITRTGAVSTYPVFKLLNDCQMKFHSYTEKKI